MCAFGVRLKFRQRKMSLIQEKYNFDGNTKNYYYYYYYYYYYDFYYDETSKIKKINYL